MKTLLKFLCAISALICLLAMDGCNKAEENVETLSREAGSFGAMAESFLRGMGGDPMGTANEYAYSIAYWQQEADDYRMAFFFWGGLSIIFGIFGFKNNKPNAQYTR